MKASEMPPGERLEELGRSGATLAIHLSIRNLAHVERALIPHYGPDCPTAVVYRATWPDELSSPHHLVDACEAKCAPPSSPAPPSSSSAPPSPRVTFRDSALYDPAHQHILRHRKLAK
jgi:precorrin-4/cobalt-precorrin-4 C11-methyltransferase